MEAIIHRFTLDCKKSGTQEVLQGFGTGDNISRKLIISLVYGSNTYEIDQDHCEALMYVKNPISGVTSINECFIEGNAVHYTVTKDDLRNAGEVIMLLKLIYTDPVVGTRNVLVAPRFALEVGETENLDDIIEQEIAKRNFEGTFTALEKAVGRAQAIYHTRLVQIEFDNEYVFHAYYADGTEYVNDGVSEAYAEIVEAREEVVTNYLLTRSYAVGDTESRPGEETDNAKYYHAVALSASEAAKDAQKRAEDAANMAQKETSYAVFSINFDTGNIEYDSSHYVFTVNESDGNLEYESTEEE